MRALLTILPLLFFQTFLFSTTYYVSNTGNNNNTGQRWDQAFATLQHAADQVKPGDTVLVANGVYTGFDFRDVDGTAQDPIVFRAAGEEVLINQSGPRRDDGINIENADYVIVDGFQVEGMTGGGNGIRVVTSNFCIVRNCYCDRNAERGIFTGFTDDIIIENNVCTNSVDEHGIYVSNSSDRPIIRFNECYGNNNIGIHMNGDRFAGGDGIISDAQVYGNILHDNNLAAGLNMDGVVNAQVYNNLIYNNHNAQGIALFQIDGGTVSQGAQIYNNTIIVPEDGRWGILLKDGANQNTQIYNNIIVNQHNWRGCIAAEDTENMGSDYNVFNDRLSANGDGSVDDLAAWQLLGLDQNSINTTDIDGLFENAGDDDLHLSANSLAIDLGQGSLPNWARTDLDGFPRPSGAGIDAGAYELQITTSLTTIDSKGLSVFPNPFTQSLNIQNSKGAAPIKEMRLMDMRGRVVDNWIGNPGVLEIEGVAVGVYFLEVVRGASSDLIKVVKLK